MTEKLEQKIQKENIGRNVLNKVKDATAYADNWLCEKIFGKELLSEEVSQYKVLEVLEQYQDVQGQFHYNSGFTDIDKYEIRIGDLIEFVREEYSNSSMWSHLYYVDAKYEIFEKKDYQNHEIRLQMGEIEGRFGKDVEKGNPFKRTTIKFKIKN